MIIQAHLERLTDVMEAMIRFELVLSDFYRSCAGVSKADEAFWESLAQVEVTHAENLQGMMALLKAKPARFEVGRPFNLMALNTAIAGIGENARRVVEGTLSGRALFVLARDIEQSIIESRYAEIVKTTDTAFLALLGGIVSQTYEHRKIIQQAIDRSERAV